jgi:hypothetical protein
MYRKRHYMSYTILIDPCIVSYILVHHYITLYTNRIFKWILGRYTQAADISNRLGESEMSGG